MEESNNSKSSSGIIGLALKNLPKGRTNLNASAGKNSTWEVDEKGIFLLDTYKTIEQTDTLAELEMDSRNPTVVVDLFKIASPNGSQEEKDSAASAPAGKRSKNPNPSDKRNVKQRIEE